MARPTLPGCSLTRSWATRALDECSPPPRKRGDRTRLTGPLRPFPSGLPRLAGGVSLPWPHFGPILRVSGRPLLNDEALAGIQPGQRYLQVHVLDGALPEIWQGK